MRVKEGCSNLPRTQASASQSWGKEWHFQTVTFVALGQSQSLKRTNKWTGTSMASLCLLNRRVACHSQWDLHSLWIITETSCVFNTFKMKPQHLFWKCGIGLKTLLQRGYRFTQHAVNICGYTKNKLSWMLEEKAWHCDARQFSLTLGNLFNRDVWWHLEP